MARNIARVLLGLILLFTGTSHLSWGRQEFLAQVPPWLPFNADFVVVASGVVELLLGLSLIFFVKHKRLVGWLTAIFFILIFPGNISQFVREADAFGLDSDRKRFLRLFFQPVLIFWALWATKAIFSSSKKPK